MFPLFSVVRELCKVIYPYTPANDDELELREGEIITILSRELPDKGWLKGELRGKTGVFPDNFVVLMSSEGMVTRAHTHTHNPPFPSHHTSAYTLQLRVNILADYNFHTINPKEIRTRKIKSINGIVWMQLKHSSFLGEIHTK